MSDFEKSTDLTFGDFESVFTYPPMQIFDSRILDFLSKFSDKILKSRKAREFPDLISFAFWCRSANLSFMKKKYAKNEFRIGLGKVLHVTPRNVPMNFAFSWAISALAGNSNFVKLPSSQFPQIDLFIELFESAHNSQTKNQVGKSVTFFRTEHNSESLRFMSSLSQGRVIWGTDETIRAIKSLESSPRVVDLSFPSRVSIAVISCHSFMSLGAHQKQNVVKKFLRDSMTFGQRGCSSPRILFWKGNLETYSEANKEFWTLANALASKYMQISDSFTRFANLSRISAELEDSVSFVATLSEPLVLVKDLPNANFNLESVLSLGTFLQKRIDNFDEIFLDFDRNLQTISYFGIEVADLLSSIERLGFLGADRIVPFGAAFDMTPVWDGFDTIRSLSRVIHIR